MEDSTARRLLIYASLAISALVFVFFMLAPPLGYPLTYEQAVRILEIVLPIFFGYIGSASAFIFSPEKAETIVHVERRQHLSVLLVGPIVVFILIFVTILTSFGISNAKDSPPGEGMSIDMLAGTVSAALGLLAVSTNLIAGKLFAK